MSLAQEQKITKIVNLLQAGLTRPRESEWAVNIFLTKNVPLPRIQNLIAKLKMLNVLARSMSKKVTGKLQ